MANCPRCGSESIQIKRDTDVDWGRAVVGTVLFGVVGGAVGAVTGEDRSANVCLNCGATWKASVLYEMLQFIEKETGKTLDLTDENERNFLNEAMTAMDLCSFEIEKIEEQAKSNISAKKEGTMGGCYGCLVAIVVAIIAGIAASSLDDFLIVAFLGGILFTWIGSNMTRGSEEELENMAKSYEEEKARARKNLKIEIRQIREKYLI